MRGRGSIPAVTILIILILIGLGIAYGLTHADISALPQPGRLETTAMTKARDWLIGRAARAVVRPAIADGADAVSKGKALYGMECDSCHGQDGRHPAPIGQSMYPRVPDLGSPEVQRLANRQLFWVVKNGIRLSGMPGFARINTDVENWQLVYFVRSLGQPGKP